MRKVKAREASELDKAIEAERQHTAALVAELEAAFAEVPLQFRQRLHAAAVSLAIDAYNQAGFLIGDAYMAMLPQTDTARVLDWYFDEKSPREAPAELFVATDPQQGGNHG